MPVIRIWVPLPAINVQTIFIYLILSILADLHNILGLVPNSACVWSRTWEFLIMEAF